MEVIILCDLVKKRKEESEESMIDYKLGTLKIAHRTKKNFPRNWRSRTDALSSNFKRLWS